MGLVESRDAMVDVPREIGRPVPVERVALRGRRYQSTRRCSEIRNIFVESFSRSLGPEVLAGRHNLLRNAVSTRSPHRRHIEDRQLLPVVPSIKSTTRHDSERIL